MNMLEGNLKIKDGLPIIDLHFSTYKLPAAAGDIIQKTAESEVILGIRPENIRISKQKKSNTLKATVIQTELTGKESNVHLKAGESPLIAIRTTTQDLTIGDQVWLSLDEEKIHVFERKSGKAIL